MSVEVVALETSSVGIYHRISGTLILAHKVGYVVADKLAYAACENHEKVSLIYFDGRFDKLVQCLDTTKDDIVFS